MNRRTVGFSEELEEFIEDVERSEDIDSFSKAVREQLKVAKQVYETDDDLDDILEATERVDELEADLEDEKNRADDLRRQLREANRQDENVGELVKYVENKRTLEQRRREASLSKRMKWWVFGMDTEKEE